ncbi:uncharacterized protein LOC129566866 [Sitodiplosis mosellana]|uniref:uncharacterized protein LOC129566866 n=1 Tax=Sitodiplosis mosellana TaxID=263140 RepID=UPI002443F60F|nr:uncharacterized protein LOC129566866 [Sitodiplosis mosellana]
MLHIFIGILCLCGAIRVWADEHQIIDIVDDNLKCGPITCPLHESHMCFYMSKYSVDINNASLITSCGTCLSINGSVIRDDCSTETTKLTNYTNRMSINLFNSTLDKTRIRNGMVGLLLSEMNNGSPSYSPYVQITTPASPLAPQGQPIVVVQPPAQYITVNSGVPIQGSSNYDAINPERNVANDFCNPPRPDCIPKRRIHPNELPPQADKMYRLLANMELEIKDITNALGDALAGGRPGFLEDRSAKSPFPVWTPGGKK